MTRFKKLYGISYTFQCPYCLKEFSVLDATKDHLIPRSRGGKAEPENIVLCCGRCNSEKGALTDKEYAEWKRLEFIRNGGLSKQRS